MKTRILTAIVLVTVFLVAYFYLPPLGWVIFSSLIAGAAFWEWGGLINASRTSRLICIGFCTLLCGFLLLENLPSLLRFSELRLICPKDVYMPLCVGVPLLIRTAAWELGRWFYLPAAFFWLLTVPLWMKFRWILPRAETLPSALLAWFVGALVILPTWLALIHLHLADTFALLSLMGVIWVADIGAYFSGRAFGRRKLAPNISPGKTWEGAIGGTLAAVLYGAAFIGDIPGQHYLVLIPLLIIVAGMSILGDLFESLLKRQAGLKDSGSLLPGHGGVLDRIDSLTSTLPLATLLWLLVS